MLTLTAFDYRSPTQPSSAYLSKRRNSIASVSNISRRDGLDPLAFSEQDLLTLGGRVYMTNVTLGGLDYTLVIDTGSSDTWIATSSFQCLSRLSQTFLPQSACGFSTLYSPESSQTYAESIKDGFEVHYTDGEFLSGDLGQEDLILGGLRLTQIIGVVERGFWLGDGLSSGLMGLAYSGLANGVESGGLDYTSVIFSL